MSKESQLDRIEAKLDTILEHFKLVVRTKEEIEAEHRNKLASQYHNKIACYIQKNDNQAVFSDVIVLEFQVIRDISINNIKLIPGEYIILSYHDHLHLNPTFYVINKKLNDRVRILEVSDFLHELCYGIYDQIIKVNDEVLK